MSRCALMREQKPNFEKSKVWIQSRMRLCAGDRMARDAAAHSKVPERGQYTTYRPANTSSRNSDPIFSCSFSPCFFWVSIVSAVQLLHVPLNRFSDPLSVPTIPANFQRRPPKAEPSLAFLSYPFTLNLILRENETSDLQCLEISPKWLLCD